MTFLMLEVVQRSLVIYSGWAPTHCKLPRLGAATHHVRGQDVLGNTRVQASTGLLENGSLMDTRVLHNLRPCAKNGDFCSQLGSKAQFIQ